MQNVELDIRRKKNNATRGVDRSEKRKDWKQKKQERMEHQAEVNHYRVDAKHTQKARYNITLEKEAVSSSVLIEKLFRFGTRLRGLGF